MFARLMSATLGPLLPWLIAIWVASLAGVGAWGYHKGGQAAEARHAITQATAYGAAVDRVLALSQQFAAIGARLADAMADSSADETVRVREVKEVIRENSEFAAIRRPADLQRLRVERLERIARAAEAD